MEEKQKLEDAAKAFSDQYQSPGDKLVATLFFKAGWNAHKEQSAIEAIEFVEWKQSEGYYGYKVGNGSWQWCKSIPSNKNKVYTTKQLYELWRQNK